MRMDWEGPDDLRGQFLLDPDIAFLNHGSFGACPRPVLARQGEWRTRMEQEPVNFLYRELPELLAQSRAALAEELGCGAEDLVFQANVTQALNTVIRSLPLDPGDEVLLGDHEYGALVRAWEAEARRRGLVLRRVELPWPDGRPEALVESFRAAVGERTRVLFVSHVSSSTALRLPVEELGVLAKERGLWLVVDGAHAPGQVPLDLASLGAEVYAGNCHKWLLAPKGCGFLHVPAGRQAWVEPLVTSWGNTNRPPEERHSPFLDELEWMGTTDPTAWLALPAALEFRRRWDWEERAARCRQALQEWGDALCGRLGLRRVNAPDPSLQMLALELPWPAERAVELHLELFRADGVELPVLAFAGRTLMRISLQPYNRVDDLERLERALARRLAVMS
jgi:isopenicillin-N epimerase